METLGIAALHGMNLLPRRDGSVWITEKDGIVAVLLMMEVMAKTGKDIGTLYADLVKKYGPYQYERVDLPALPEKKKRFQLLLHHKGLFQHIREM